ncbi:hypothetical protein NW768_008667 [Fusarium equiseti]|uniref:NACHT domain-containing protein n=1 Tax=Fusarium equiseti TaxID=61235 RepID=A0ABQ8R4P2_FUSEQ|nr:hypothetical protein NW768_008667 [Fusarium equiseti]
MPLKPAISSLARNTIKSAHDELDRIISPGEKRNFAETTLQDVQDAALKLENQLAARQSLRNMRRLMPLFRGLEHYSKVAEILCNGTPFMPWIWAPITLILRVASEYVEAFEAIIKGYASIAEPLKRFEILSNAFISEPSFQQTLAVFYADILTFHKYAYKFVRRSGWALMFSTSWGRFQRRFDNIIEDLNKHGALIDLEANARDIAEAKMMRENIQKWREESEDRVRQQDREQNAKQYESIVSWLKTNETDQLAIIDSISSDTTEYQGTCAWILKNKRIVSWADARPDTPALWLKGSAGSGKSVLCTQLVNFLKGTKTVAYHFCSYLYDSSTMFEQVLKSLILQIIRKDGDLVSYVFAHYILERKSSTSATLEQLLQKLLASMSNVPNQASYIWLVIDGLDECEKDRQLRLVRLLNQLISKPVVPGSTTCKVLVASRGPSETLERLRRKQIISLAEEKESLDTAIRQYVGLRLETMHPKLRQIDIQHSEVEEIQNTIVKKADGMFLYARLVIDYLTSNVFYSGDEMKESVNQLPRKLTEFYQRILTQILVQLDSRSVDRIRCVLGWVAFAKRPLKKVELLSAITFSSGDPQVSRLVPQYILDICGTLIEESRDTTVTFIHNSVKEFLQTASTKVVITRDQAIQEHGVASMACLLSGLESFRLKDLGQNQILLVAKGLYGFLVYATEFWTEYLLCYEPSQESRLESSPEPFLRLAGQLANELERLDPTNLDKSASGDLVDKRLAKLQKYGVLWKHVECALNARSPKSLEARVFKTQAEEGEEGTGHCSKSLPLSDPISDLLTSYQEVVKALIGQTFHAGISASELEYFRAHLGTSAFTCHLTACSRATIGFTTEKMLREHERSHINWLRCTAPGCQYPPRFSPRTLKVHMNKHHPSSSTPKPIRRPVSKKVYIPISGSDADVDPDFDTFLGHVGSRPEINGYVPPQLIHPNQGLGQSLSPVMSPLTRPHKEPQQWPDVNQLNQNSFSLAVSHDPYGVVNNSSPLPITPPLGYRNNPSPAPPPLPAMDVPPTLPAMDVPQTLPAMDVPPPLPAPRQLGSWIEGAPTEGIQRLQSHDMSPGSMRIFIWSKRRIQ